MKKLIVANWKMNPKTARDAERLLLRVKRKAAHLKKARCIVCPPYVYLDRFAKRSGGKLSFGAQDVFYEKEGAFTGEISPAMLFDIGVKYVICGHSERRALGEGDEVINKKVRAALFQGLSVILCVGEKERDRDGKYLDFVREELREGLAKIPKKFFKNVIIAYEPVWAIGEGSFGPSTPEDFLEQSIFIRKVLSHIVDTDTAMAIPILYGGSLDEENAAAFFTSGRADGLLVGRSSLSADSFNTILSVADKA